MTHALDWIRQHARHMRRLDAGRLRHKLGRQKGECTWCGGPVGPGRRSWCGDQCVESFKLTCDPAWVQYRIRRWLVGGRHRSLYCEACGLDVGFVQNWLRKFVDLRRTCNHDPDFEHLCSRTWNGKQNRRSRRNRRKLVRLTRIALTSYRYGSGHSNQIRAWLTRAGLQDPCWELDHTVPVCEGGGCCGPEGLRVLCIPCHRATTAALARRRGLRKRLSRGITT